MLCGGGPCRGLRRGGIVKVGFDELSSVWQGGKRKEDVAGGADRTVGDLWRWGTSLV